MDDVRLQPVGGSVTLLWVSVIIKGEYYCIRITFFVIRRVSLAPCVLFVSENHQEQNNSRKIWWKWDISLDWKVPN